MDKLNPLFETNNGILYLGDSEEVVKKIVHIYKSKINLLLTSPPFPLKRKKKYGNLEGTDYIEWLTRLCTLFSELLSDDGSLVIEIGNTWDSGLPTLSTLPIETLLSIKKEAKLHLCQEFFWFNTAKLPSPAEWVNKKRIRVKDSLSRIWWMSKTPYPKANNRNILTEYSRSMEKLLKTGKYNPGVRPSEYIIGNESFLVDNEGAIPANIIVAANTNAHDGYLKGARKKGLDIHPARMPCEIAEYFIKFLTDENDIIFDPFSGSNITGFTAETLNRKWLSIEIKPEYAKGSISRFKREEENNV
jgi:site-specific DNA-methyltransferase (cytosine-N4-specific)